jgi:hypothetical protein
METGHERSGPALRAESPRQEHHRRRSQAGAFFAGAAAGVIAGILVEWAIGSERLTGHADDPLSLGFGLPVAMGIALGLFALLIATAREDPVEDAPVRERRFRRLGRAAASKQGQLPGSPVPPAHHDGDR